jgi:microcystin-dependent protein
MASTFSPSLRLELIGDGDQSGIWGQTTNNNLGGLLEQAISGVVAISMLDANYTLSNFNGVVDEARNQVVTLTGTLSAQRNLVAPLVEKTYIIKNTTTGGFGVQVIGASGTGVIIPNGTTTSVYCDGTNFYAANTGSAGNQTINGNLTVTGTTALTGALTASTATFSGAISSVNPTFTGTPTAPTALAGTSTTQIATTAFVQNVAGALGTMSTQNANNVAITGGAINGVSGTNASMSVGNVTGTIASAVTATTQAVTTNNTTVATTAFVRSIIPAGVILMWSGSVASIPSGWYLCNGANGTPNLLDRFVIAAGSGYAVGATGGATTASLIEANLPSHTHSLSASGTTSTVNVDHTHSLSASGTTSTESANHTHPIGGSTGGQSVTHTHGISDPGHAHGFANNLIAQGNTGQQGRTDGSQASVITATAAAATGITGTGGNSVDHSHTLPANTGTISANHTHTVSVTGTSGAMSANSTHSHTVTVTGTSGATGSGTAFSILPPYFALAYIMKS